MKIVLDSDAAIFIAGTSLCEDFFSNLPVYLTRYCYKEELPGLENSQKSHVSMGTQKVRQKKQDGEIDILPDTVWPSESDERLYNELKNTYDLDGGELSILRCLFWDASDIAVVAAQDSDARFALNELVSRTEFTLQIGSPALALGLLILNQDGLSVDECMEAMEPQVKTEKWDWNMLKADYRADLESVLRD